MNEVGGTSVFILSAVPFEQLALRTDLPKQALPPITAGVLSYVPDVATVGTVLLGGIYWITHRREEVARAEGRVRRVPQREAVREPAAMDGQEVRR